VHGSGLEIVERTVRANEIGAPPAALSDQIIAVVRAGAVLPFDTNQPLASSDTVIVVRSQPSAPPG
jgi:hypothetical protein